MLNFPNAPNGHQLIYGLWEAPGNYTLPVTGSVDLDVDGTTMRYSVIGTNGNLDDFGGNMICAFDGEIGATIQVQCSGGASGPFQNSNSGTFAKINCSHLPAARQGMAVAGIRRRG